MGKEDYKNEKKGHGFLCVPKELLFDNRYKQLTIEAILLYAYMLDRLKLSIENGWKDSDGKVFIYFSLESIMDLLKCSKGKAISTLKELDEKHGIGLIEKKRSGYGKCSRIYVKEIFELSVSENEKTREKNEEDLEVTNKKHEKSKNKMSRSSKIEPIEVKKINPNNTNKSNTNKSNTILLVGTMIASSILAGCGSKKSEPTKKETSGELKGDITFWHSFTQGPRMEVIQQTADQFMKDNPGVKIKIETFSWGDFYTKWTTGLASGNVPDMSTALPGHYHKLTSAEKTVADFFIHNNQNTDFSSSHIAELLYTSKATLSRFAKKIGYRGYQEFIYQYENTFEEKEEKITGNTKIVLNAYQEVLNKMHLWTIYLIQWNI